MAQTGTMVLTEEEALELLAYLITAARTQLDEAAEYGPLRLLIAAQRLATFIAPRASPATRALAEGPIQQAKALDPEQYAAALDSVCRAVAEHLVSEFGIDS
jgi:Family of unknown function (DUF6092)